jgi:pimeloyl-ACP methyl ester carboxylesterase
LSCSKRSGDVAWRRFLAKTGGSAVKPDTRYAHSAGVNIAYQVLGDGPRDLVYVPGWVSNIEVSWEEPALSRFLTRLASFSRVILFDKCGTGLSDRVADMPSLEVRMDDVRAVMDAVGSQQAALFGTSEGGPMCALFSATYPMRVSALIMAGSYPRRTRAPDFPYGPSEEESRDWIVAMQREWGGPFGLEARAPSRAGDQRFRDWWARFLRMSASPAAASALTTMNAEIDIRHILSSIRVPTLILHSIQDRAIDFGASRYMADRIEQAKLVQLSGPDHLVWLSDADAILGEIEEFLTGARNLEPDRVLATVMFTDIVGSTEEVVGLGDRRWHDLLDSHHGLVRRELDRFRGREINTAGDGPARAIRCACAISDGVKSLGLKIRAGLHTGECEIIGEEIGGIAVHIGARIAALAAPGQVLVSGTVKDLVAGSGLSFQDHGAKSLKGVPGEWRLFAVAR